MRRAGHRRAGGGNGECNKTDICIGGRAYGAPAHRGDIQMPAGIGNHTNVGAERQQQRRRPASADEAWDSLGRRARTYIIMQHGRIDGQDAREACGLPWPAVRGAIESTSDEFDAGAADAAIVAAAASASQGGCGA